MTIAPMAAESKDFGNMPFVWQMHLFGANPEEAVIKILNTFPQINGVLIQGTDGPYRAQYDKKFGPNVTDQIADLFRNKDKSVAIWGPIYGTYDIRAEARKAAETANEAGASFFAADQEGRFENVENKYLTNVIKKLLVGNPQEIQLAFEKLAKVPDAINILVTEYKNHTDIPLWYCGFAWYESFTTKSPWHPKEIVQIFLQLGDGGLPMAYALSSLEGQAYKQVIESFMQWSRVNPSNKPLIMGLKGFSGDGTVLTQAIIRESSRAAMDLKGQGKNVSGEAFWHLNSLLTNKNPPVLDTFNGLPLWEAGLPSESHTKTVEAYGARVDAFARDKADKAEQIIKLTKDYDQELRKIGYNSDYPPTELSFAVPLLEVLSAMAFSPGELIEVTEEFEALNRGIQNRLFVPNSGHRRTIFDSAREAIYAVNKAINGL